MRPTTHQRRRLGTFAAATTIALVALALTASGAFAGAIVPESGGSPNANEIASLYKLVLYVAIIVFVVVEGALIYSLVRFRASKGAVPAQIHGNTNLEIGWTVGAALILVVLSIFTFSKLGAIKNPVATGPNGWTASANGAQFAAVNQPQPPGGGALNIDVNGQQYVWRYTYPGGTYAYEEMVVPINTTVTLDIRSQDVAHSWWIPKLGGKFDALPGYTNHTWFKISKPGVYVGQCAELCGRNHANMLARVRAVPVNEFQSWLDSQKAGVAAANKAAAAERNTLSPTAEKAAEAKSNAADGAAQ